MGVLSKIVIAVAATTAVFAPAALAQRPMENLGRGVVAVRSNETAVLVGWRLLGLDDESIGFNVYRATGSGNPKLLNSKVLTGGTNFHDLNPNLAESNTYHVRPVLNGKEAADSGKFTLAANNAAEPVVRIPIKSGGVIKYLWVGDLDGDGEYDYVIDRQTAPSTLEAYRSDGKFLWEINMGPNSVNQNNIEPGSSALNVGHWDGITVYDFDSDGKAEVAVRIANGVVFGDGKTFSGGNGDDDQYIAIINGETGALRATAHIENEYLSDGPLAARFGVGYLDGVTPHLVTYMKNRQPGQGAFNLIMAAWKFDGKAVKLAWRWVRGDQDASDGHNTRIIDLNGDGKDEVCEIGFALNGDGTLRYSLAGQGIGHGDRFHISKMDPSRAGLQGYGIQQDNPSLLMEYLYDASTGKLIWEHFGTEVGDVARGMAGDIDPRSPGMEVWAFDGVYNAATNKLTEEDTTLAPWPQLGLWWDGDALMELYNDGKFEQWDWLKPSVSGKMPRFLKISDYGGSVSTRNPLFLGDILGDWREEVVVTNANYDELLIFSTNIPSDIRLYTLPHNPAYRNAMTLKGYMQSHHVDYFLGDRMKTPPKPNIYYVGA
ncbi:hypothetical protein VE01_08954 [Pseudogymnoascus verrucosus]|uniref:Uncharacterized protein n=1 Tax=Pseudogymnoascus verrucosus TaxID=342668 RepID=A0A1B8GAV3_9PEZI|nr:uncharacterized protein VE01_08954 [Pseudogymnoascus verrucosus]OBT92907.1 hypothetical protein VE01_08954 [Pseudogymnoascus verrucosus]